MTRKAIVTAVGHYVPPDVLTNFDLEKRVDTNNEWIVARTGIKERRILSPELGCSYMAEQATRMLLDENNIDPADIDLIVYATVTPDMFFPSTACILQDLIGAKNAWGFDISAACSGFVYAMDTATKFIESGQYKKILVVGADKMSAIVDPTDRNTCILFGDAAGAILMEPGEDQEHGLMDSILRSDGSGGQFLLMKGGGSLHPATQETVAAGMHYAHQDGKTVFKFAVKGMADISAEVMEKNGLTGEDIKFFIPHQANLRIIDAAARRMGLKNEQVVVNIDRYGNTTAATIPLALSEIYHEGKLDRGDNIIIAAFGAGFTWGGIWLKWAI